DVLPDLALERVLHDHVAIGDAQAERRWTLPRARRHAVGAARARVARPLLAGVGRARDAGDVRARAVAEIDEVARGERRDRRLVRRAALRLAVGRPRPTDVRTLVPVEPQPPEILELPLFDARDDARTVEILDAQDEHASGDACRAPRDDRRGGRAEMEVAGGGGRE